jgi:hypothetical protein
MQNRTYAKIVTAGLLLGILMIFFVNSFQANAAAPHVRSQSPSFYRMILGDFEITALLDGTHPFPIETLMTNVTKDEIQRDLSRDDLTSPVQGSIKTGRQRPADRTGQTFLYSASRITAFSPAVRERIMAPCNDGPFRRYNSQIDFLLGSWFGARRAADCDV